MQAGRRSPIRILILDDHAVVCEGLALLLSCEPDFLVAAKCGSIEAALQVLSSEPADVVLLDIDLGANSGLNFCTVARDLGYSGKVLVVTAGVAEHEIIRMMAQGVSGVFLKHSAPHLLPEAIRKVHAGEVWLDARLSPEAPADPQDGLMRRLTDRERQVLMAVYGGMSNKEIAARLHITDTAVKSALQQLFSKSGVRSRGQLVRLAAEFIGARTR